MAAGSWQDRELHSTTAHRQWSREEKRIVSYVSSPAHLYKTRKLVSLPLREDHNHKLWPHLLEQPLSCYREQEEKFVGLRQYRRSDKASFQGVLGLARLLLRWFGFRL